MNFRCSNITIDQTNPGQLKSYTSMVSKKVIMIKENMNKQVESPFSVGYQFCKGQQATCKKNFTTLCNEMFG